MPTCPKCQKNLSTHQALAYHMNSSSCKIQDSESSTEDCTYRIWLNLQGEIISLCNKLVLHLGIDANTMVGNILQKFVHSDDTLYLLNTYLHAIVLKEQIVCARLIIKQTAPKIILGSLELCRQQNFLIKFDFMHLSETSSFVVTDSKFEIISTNKLFFCNNTLQKELKIFWILLLQNLFIQTTFNIQIG